MKEYTTANINETLKQSPCWTDPPEPVLDNDEVELERQARQADHDRDREI